MRIFRCGLGWFVAATALAGSAFAQYPEQALAQMAHRSWTLRDGAPGNVMALAQTRDGYLWLGGASGLFRFDGVRFERYAAPAGQVLPSNNVNVLKATADGALWVGHTFGGVSVITATGRLVNYDARDGVPAGTVTSLALDSLGVMWVATTRGLAQLSGARWRIEGPDRGFSGGFVTEIDIDARGALWVAASTGVLTLARGASRFEIRAPPLAVGEQYVGTGSVRAAPDGTVWAVSAARGIMQLTDAVGQPASRQMYYTRDRGPARGWLGMYIDRRMHAWGITTDRVVRVSLLATGRASGAGSRSDPSAKWDTLPFSPSTGASGRSILAVLEDREGTVWIATNGGLDQFRVAKFTSLPWPVSDYAPSLAAGDSGMVWASSRQGRVTVLGSARSRSVSLPPDVDMLHRDAAGEIWFAGPAGLWHTRDKRIEQVQLPPALQNSRVMAIAGAGDGTLWLSAERVGTFRKMRGRWERYAGADSLALALAADGDGGMWLGYANGTVRGELARAGREYGPSDGLDVGTIRCMTADGRRIWVGGERGLAMIEDDTTRGSGVRVAHARAVTLVGKAGPFRSVSGIVAVEDAVWISDDEGVARIFSDDVARARSDSDYRVPVERLDTRDGITGALGYGNSNMAIRGTDGRIWFAWNGGLGWIDPAQVHRNRAPPPISIRRIASGARDYSASSAVSLPPNTRSFSAAFTALSLAIPERVRFRYRLAGLDTGWQDAGTRREAFFTNLAPGAYRFEVTAANEDGVWSVKPASLDITIPPTFVQTELFRALCFAAGIGALYAFVVWRQRRVMQAVRARSHAVFAERIRVARELHDTLLSDMAGMAMRLDALTSQAARDPDLAVSVLPQLRDQARRTLDETRLAVTAMRDTAGELLPLSEQLAEAARRVFTDTPVRVDVRATGTAQRLAPIVEAETLRIATEALMNARRHSDCSVLVLSCRFATAWLEVGVADDGRGFSISADGEVPDRPGHWGIIGMRERAAGLGGTVTISSAPGHGTTIRLRVPLTTDTRLEPSHLAP